jgi:uncharacterized protein (TIGR03067 family)
VFEQEGAPKKQLSVEEGREIIATRHPSWTFRGSNLTVHHVVDGHEAEALSGSFSLGPGGAFKSIDFSVANPNGAEFVGRGIYQFDGEFLKVCHRMSRRQDSTKPLPERPDSFSGSAGVAYVKFKRP